MVSYSYYSLDLLSSANALVTIPRVGFVSVLLTFFFIVFFFSFELEV